MRRPKRVRDDVYGGQPASPPLTPTFAKRYENATNVTRNAAETIHMSGLMSRQ